MSSQIKNKKNEKIPSENSVKEQEQSQHIAERLKQLRSKLNISASYIAEKTGLYLITIYKLENEGLSRSYNLWRLLEFYYSQYNINPSYILLKNNEGHPLQISKDNSLEVKTLKTLYEESFHKVVKLENELKELKNGNKEHYLIPDLKKT